jgi:hypothetical protein
MNRSDEEILAMSLHAAAMDSWGKFAVLSELFEGPEGKAKITEIVHGLVPKDRVMYVVEIKVVEIVRGK